MLNTVTAEESEPPARKKLEDNAWLSNLKAEIRIADGSNFDLIERYQFRHYSYPAGILYIVKKGDYRSGIDMLYGLFPEYPRVGLININDKIAKLYHAGGLLTEGQYKKIEKILEDAGLRVRRM